MSDNTFDFTNMVNGFVGSLDDSTKETVAQGFSTIASIIQQSDTTTTSTAPTSTMSDGKTETATVDDAKDDDAKGDSAPDGLVNLATAAALFINSYNSRTQDPPQPKLDELAHTIEGIGYTGPENMAYYKGYVVIVKNAELDFAGLDYTTTQDYAKFLEPELAMNPMVQTLIGAAESMTNNVPTLRLIEDEHVVILNQFVCDYNGEEFIVIPHERRILFNDSTVCCSDGKPLTFDLKNAQAFISFGKSQSPMTVSTAAETKNSVDIILPPLSRFYLASDPNTIYSNDKPIKCKLTDRQIHVSGKVGKVDDADVVDVAPQNAPSSLSQLNMYDVLADKLED